MRLAALAFLACFAAPLVAQSKPDTHTVTVIRSSDAHRGVPIPAFRDSIEHAEIRKAARAALPDGSNAEAHIVRIRGDTATVNVGSRVSGWTQVRVVKKWVAVRDSIEVRAIR